MPAVAQKTRLEKLGRTVVSFCEFAQAGNASPRWPKEGKHVELVPGEALAVMDGGRKGID